jgi:hypothetical protein
MGWPRNCGVGALARTVRFVGIVRLEHRMSPRGVPAWGIAVTARRPPRRSWRGLSRVSNAAPDGAVSQPCGLSNSWQRCLVRMSTWRRTALGVAWLCVPAVGLVGCGDDGSASSAASASSGGETYAKARVEPIAQRALERKHPDADVANVSCDSRVMVVVEGALTHCTARIDRRRTDWTLAFRDSSGKVRLRQVAASTGSRVLG